MNTSSANYDEEAELNRILEMSKKHKWLMISLIEDWYEFMQELLNLILLYSIVC
jgi:hypothetical protein